MGHCARKLHGLAAARTSDALAVFTHLIYSPIHKLRASRDRASRTRYWMRNLAD